MYKVPFLPTQSHLPQLLPDQVWSSHNQVKENPTRGLETHFSACQGRWGRGLRCQNLPLLLEVLTQQCWCPFRDEDVPGPVLCCQMAKAR